MAALQSHHHLLLVPRGGVLWLCVVSHRIIPVGKIPYEQLVRDCANSKKKIGHETDQYPDLFSFALMWQEF